MQHFYGKTVESAIETGLQDLNLTKEDAIITIVDEGAKGVLGFGGKKAEVIIEAKKDNVKRATDFLDGLFELLNIPVSCEVNEIDDKIVYNLITTSSSSIIGYRGETLDAIQTLAGAVVNIGNEEYKRVVVDCEGYRQKREDTLKALALRLADKAVKSGRPVTLEPMNPFERRVIHSALADSETVKTESQGVEPKRHVVIIPNNLKKNDKKGFKNKKEKQSGFKSEMIKITTKTSGFGTFLGNSLKKED